MSKKQRAFKNTGLTIMILNGLVLSYFLYGTLLLNLTIPTDFYGPLYGVFVVFMVGCFIFSMSLDNSL